MSQRNKNWKANKRAKQLATREIAKENFIALLAAGKIQAVVRLREVEVSVSSKEDIRYAKEALRAEPAFKAFVEKQGYKVVSGVNHPSTNVVWQDLLATSFCEEDDVSCDVTFASQLPYNWARRTDAELQAALYSYFDYIEEDIITDFVCRFDVLFVKA